MVTSLVRGLASRWRQAAPGLRAGLAIALLAAVLGVEIAGAAVRHQSTDALLAELRSGRSPDPVFALFRLSKRDRAQAATAELIREVLTSSDEHLIAFARSTALRNLGYPELDWRRGARGRP